VILAVNVAFHAALAWSQAGEHSLYTNRPVIASAIRDKQPQMFAHRRPYAINAGPRALDDALGPYGLHDLTIDSQTVRRGLGGAAVWTLTVTNRSSHVAFRNLVYATTYTAGEGAHVQQHEDVIKDVLQPGRSKEFRIADTIVDRPFTEARIVIRAAEALLPVP
jgi:hypothetical protein